MEIQTRNMMAVFLQVLHQVPPATPTSSFWDWLNHQLCRIANYMISSLIFRVPKVGTWNEWFVRCTSNTLGQRPSLAKRRKWLQWVQYHVMSHFFFSGCVMSCRVMSCHIISSAASLGENSSHVWLLGRPWRELYILFMFFLFFDVLLLFLLLDAQSCSFCCDWMVRDGFSALGFS